MYGRVNTVIQNADLKEIQLSKMISRKFILHNLTKWREK